MGVAFVVLLIACANLANLLLARAAARQPELSLRVALGASRGRIARQLLIESLLVAAAGAAGGLILARITSRTLVRALSTINTTVYLDVALDWRSLAFTAALGTLTAVFFGMAPALRGMRVQPSDALRHLGRSAGTAAHGRFGHALVVAQVALSLVLLVAAGLFLRTFTTLAHRELGFDAAPVLTAQIVPGARMTAPERAAWSARVLAAATGVPGVRSAALSTLVPLSGNNWNNRVDLAAGPPRPDAPLTYFNVVTPGWFATYGTTILDGRDFDGGDAAAAAPVAIVNEAFARVFTGGRSPVGVELREPGNGAPIVRRVVGWVRDAVYESMREPPPPTLYLPFAQVTNAPAEAVLSVRAATGAPGSLARPLATALGDVDGSASLTFRRLAAHVDDRLTRERLLAILAVGFGVLAVVLAGVGLYGVTAYSVNRKRSEIAVRMALGASQGRVVGQVLSGVAARVALGAAAGAALTAWIAPVVSTLLYGLTPRDGGTMAMATLLLAAVAALAAWIPARRAARIDPARVLRDG
jgi:predicted permease